MIQNKQRDLISHHFLMLTLPTFSNPSGPWICYSFCFRICAPDTHMGYTHSFTSFRSLLVCHLSKRLSLATVFKIGLALYFWYFQIPLLYYIFLHATQHLLAYYLCIFCLYPVVYEPYKDWDSINYCIFSF